MLNPMDFKLGILIDIKMKMIFNALQVSGSRPFSNLLPKGSLVFHKQLVFIFKTNKIPSKEGIQGNIASQKCFILDLTLKKTHTHSKDWFYLSHFMKLTKKNVCQQSYKA